MANTAADVLIDVLHEWGVEVVFGLPGDGINGIMEALRKRQDEIRFIQVRHEEAAAFMAADTPSSRDDSACASPRPDQVVSISSMVSTTPSLMDSRSSH
jgi:glyoxylate carboligase